MAWETPLRLPLSTGDRGFGVAVLDRAEDALSWLVTHPREALAQEFCPGFEFGASWERDPRDPLPAMRPTASSRSARRLGGLRNTVRAVGAPRHVSTRRVRRYQV